MAAGIIGCIGIILLVILAMSLSFGVSYGLAWLVIDLAEIAVFDLTTFQLAMIIFVLTVIFGGSTQASSK